jgi:hypothetical protein
VGKNLFIIVSSSAYHREYAEPFFTQVPLALLLVAAAVPSAVLFIQFMISVQDKDFNPLTGNIAFSRPCKPQPF